MPRHSSREWLFRTFKVAYSESEGAARCPEEDASSGSAEGETGRSGGGLLVPGDRGDVARVVEDRDKADPLPERPQPEGASALEHTSRHEATRGTEDT